MRQQTTFLIFRLALTVIVVIIQWYFYRRTLRYARSAWRPQATVRIIQAVFLLFNLPLFVLIFVRPNLLNAPQWFVHFVISPFYVWHGTFLVLFVILFCGYMLRLPIAGAILLLGKLRPIQQRLQKAREDGRLDRWSLSRRRFLHNGFTILSGVTFAGTAYGAYSKYDYEISNVSIPVRNLPPQFQGFTITLVADIHSSIFMTKEDMQRYVSAINEIGSDLIVIPGDFVNSMVEEVYPFAEAFSDLKAPFGIYGTLGNHDFFTDAERITREVDACGVKMLRTDKVDIQKNGVKIHLLGIDDTGRMQRAESFHEKALANTESNTPKILLCHRPYFFDQAAKKSIDLVLAGHTHGGQIVFARIGNTIIAPALVASPYVAGLYNKEHSHMYVTRGLGTVGIPVRINCPPEITRITLIKSELLPGGKSPPGA